MENMEKKFSDKIRQANERNKRAPKFAQTALFRLFCCKFWIFQGGIRGIDSCGKAIPVESLRRKSGFRFHAACCGGRQCRGECAAEKGKKPKKLWQKCPQHADQQERQRIVEAAKKIEATEGKAWVDLIYQANGMRRRKAVNTDA